MRACMLLVLAALAPLDACGEMSAGFQLSARVEPGCLVNGGPPDTDLGVLGTLDFGVHPSLSTDTVQATLLRQAGIVLACTPGTPVVLRVDGGQHFDGSRRMRRDATTVLPYRLYRQPGCVDEIPVGTDIAIDTTSAPDDIAIPLHGCATLPGNAAAGIYQDTLIVTLAW